MVKKSHRTRQPMEGNSSIREIADSRMSIHTVGCLHLFGGHSVRNYCEIK